MTRIAAAIALVGLSAALSTPFHAAHAAKAQFERTKPHVNVPTVPSGNAGSASGMMWNGSLPNGAGNGMWNGTYNGSSNGMPSPAAPRRR